MYVLRLRLKGATTVRQELRSIVSEEKTVPNIGPYTQSHFQGLLEELEQARQKLKLRDRLSLWLAEKRISFAGRCWRLKLRIKMYLGLVEVSRLALSQSSADGSGVSARADTFTSPSIDPPATSARSFENPDHVDIVVHNYRWRLGIANGEPRYDDLERKLAKGPAFTVPTITLEGDANGAPHPDPSAYAARFSGKYEPRTISGGVGHNLPQEAPEAFAEAISDVDAY